MSCKEIYKGSISGGMCAIVNMDFEEQGSSIIFPSDNNPYCVISIGCAFADWGEVFDGVLHEMMEYHMICMELGYQRWYRAGCDTGDIWFRMSHGEYSEAISRASQSILCFIDLARTEYDSHMKKLIANEKRKASRKKN